MRIRVSKLGASEEGKIESESGEYETEGSGFQSGARRFEFEFEFVGEEVCGI